MAVLVREGRGRATSYVTSDVIECRCKDQDLSFEINQDEKLGESTINFEFPLRVSAGRR